MQSNRFDSATVDQHPENIFTRVLRAVNKKIRKNLFWVLNENVGKVQKTHQSVGNSATNNGCSLAISLDEAPLLRERRYSTVLFLLKHGNSALSTKKCTEQMDNNVDSANEFPDNARKRNSFVPISEFPGYDGAQTVARCRRTA